MRLPGPRPTAIVLTTAVMLIAPSVSLAQAPGRAAVATTSHFVFYSDFATNLNDALIAAGGARRANKTELFHSGSEKACFDDLPAAGPIHRSRTVPSHPATRGSRDDGGSDRRCRSAVA